MEGNEFDDEFIVLWKYLWILFNSYTITSHPVNRHHQDTTYWHEITDHIFEEAGRLLSAPSSVAQLILSSPSWRMLFWPYLFWFGWGSAMDKLLVSERTSAYLDSDRLLCISSTSFQSNSMTAIPRPFRLLEFDLNLRSCSRRSCQTLIVSSKTAENRLSAELDREEARDVARESLLCLDG